MCCWNGSPAALSSQLTTPRCQSNSQVQTVIAATTGMAQASRSAICSMMRTAAGTARMSSASRVPMSMVTAAVAKQNSSDRPTTVQR